MSSSSQRNQWLDVCRAIAISLVVLSHGFELLRNPAIALTQGIFGAMGVEIFFCLSGFLIGSLFLRAMQGFDGSIPDLLNFMARRWMRTLPNYYFYLALNFFLVWIGWTTIKEVHLAPYLFFYQNLLWPHPAFFGEAWSLAVEEVFYLLLPVTFFLAWLVVRKPTGALVFALLTLLITSMALRYHTAAATELPWDTYLRKISLFRLDSLMWGVLLAVLHWRLSGRRDRLLRIIGCLMLCFLPLPLLGFIAHIPSGSSFTFRFLILTFASIGISGALSLGMNLRFPQSVVAVTGRISKWSYSMYLANMPAYYLFINYVEPTVKFRSPTIDLCVEIVIVVAASIVTYTLIEKPFLAARERMIPARSASAVASRNVRLTQSSS